MALPNGWLGYLQHCWGYGPPLQAVTLWAYNMRTGAIRRLVPYPLPFQAGYYSYAPGMRDGVINNGDGCTKPSRRWIGPVSGD